MDSIFSLYPLTKETKKDKRDADSIIPQHIARQYHVIMICIFKEEFDVPQMQLLFAIAKQLNLEDHHICFIFDCATMLKSR